MTKLTNDELVLGLYNMCSTFYYGILMEKVDCSTIFLVAVGVYMKAS